MPDCCQHSIFGLAPRITVASCIAFLAGSFVSAYVMSRRKQRGEKSRLAGRLALSSVLGEGDIRRNFTKFLISKDGSVIKRFPPVATPEDLEPEIEAMLK